MEKLWRRRSTSGSYNHGMKTESIQLLSRFVILLALLALAGCAAAAPDAFAPAALEAATAAPIPISTVTLAPSATLDPSTPTPTPIPRHPLEIEVMRQVSYPGSEIAFERTLAAGGNFERHIVSYQSEGYKIYALMTIPQGERPATGWPVIVFNHGYIPPEVYRSDERYLAHVDSLASHEYIVFRPDYRGHGFSEGEPTGGYGTPDYTVDVLNALASVQRYPDADPARVGMWGHSMGGQITLRAMVVSDQIDAGVIWAGVVASYPDLFTYWFDRPGQQPSPTPDPVTPRRRWRAELIALYGSPEENPAFWASVSPNSYLADISGPLQIHHATGDEDVPYVLSELLHRDMQAAGQVSDLWIYTGDNHNISQNFSLAMQQTIFFFEEHVKNGG